MFQYIEKVLAPQTFIFQILENNRVLTFREVIEHWQYNASFRLFYNDILQEVPFMGFFWEHKAVTQNNLDQTYEFVIVGTPAFQGKQVDKVSFKNYFSSSQTIVDFPNLGKTAHLVVPSPSGVPSETYIHLAAFIRNAPISQLHDFWQHLGFILMQHINDKPTWLSTSGLGVYWLHVRLDQRPKYYTYLPYKIP